MDYWLSKVLSVFLNSPFCAQVFLKALLLTIFHLIRIKLTNIAANFAIMIIDMHRNKVLSKSTNKDGEVEMYFIVVKNQETKTKTKTKTLKIIKQ